MHEYSIVQSLVDSVEEAIKGRDSAAVRRLTVRIGELSGVDTTLLASAYDIFRAGTVCEDADMAIERVEARWACPVCSAVIERGEALQCAACNVPAELKSGDEIILQRIELEVQ